MGLSYQLREQIARHTLGVSPYSNVSPLYVALLKELSAAGQNYDEVSGSGYERKQLNPADLTSPSNGESSNVSDIVWDPALADWGTVRYAALFTSDISGDMVSWFEFPRPRFIATSAIFRILENDLKITMEGAFGLHLRNNLIDFIFRDGSFSIPSALYCGLGRSPGSNNSSLSEPPSGTGYSRIEVASFSQTGNGSYAITSPDPMLFSADDGDWGDITHVGLWDSSTGGNLFYALELDDSRKIFDGDGIQFDSGSVVINVV